MKQLRYWMFAILFMGAIDITLPDTDISPSPQPVETGLNGKHLKEGLKLIQKGWKSIKGCSRCKRVPDEPIKMARPIPANNASQIFLTTEMLSKGIAEIKSTEEIIPQIEEYLARTKPHEGSAKVITCLKTDASRVRVILSETGRPFPLQNREVNASIKALDLNGYDTSALTENVFIGPGNIEYVQFVIPRKPQFILHGEFQDRVYECMIFNVPKDQNGNWRKFKEFIIRFFDDILNRPDKLWEEAKFIRGLQEISINPRDIMEIKQYQFAQIKYTNSIFYNEFPQFFKNIQQEIA